MESQAQMETKRRELIKIRLDSTDIIRRCSIIKRIKQKERIVSQKMLIEKQRRIKQISAQRWQWHQERMNVKDKELIKFLNEETDKKKTRMESIYSRAQHSEENKNVCNERQKCVFEEHQRIEDTHLVEARQWEGKVCDKRAKAAAEWRHKMNIKQSVADSRMADIEKSKCERKKNALERKKDQIAESLKELEKMNVTVLGTTGYGSHELANIHRDASKIRNLKHYFKTQKRIAANLEKKFYVDPRKTIRNKLKQERLSNRIQHNLKIAEARARHTEFNMRRRRQILNGIIQKDKQAAELGNANPTSPSQLIRRVRLERDEMESQAQMETKRRELIKIRLDSTDIIRRCSIIKRIKQKERIVSQKMLIEKQRRIKQISAQRWQWHQERMNVKDKELIKFLNEETDKKKTRMESIYSRAQHSEENKNVCNERQKCVFEEHQRIEDTHLVEARQWEGKVCDKRAKAAAEWRHKMNIKQSVADSRMADIEKSKCERKKNALERKKDQIAESLKELEKMNVTVLGTTGYGSHELANIHRDASKIRFSAYYDPGRDTIDPCRTTQFHSYFKPLHVIHAKYLPGLSPPPRKVDTRPARKVRIKKQPVTIVEEPVSVKSTSTVDSSTSSVPDSLLEELLSDLLQEELEDVVQECLAEEEEGGEEVSEYSSVQRTYVQSNFSLASDQESSTAYGESMDTCGSEFDMDDLVMDVVAKLMACLKGPVDADSVYSGQTSTTDCTTRDGESIVTDIVLRLIATIQHFTRESEMTVSESVQSILSSSVDSCTSRSTLKDLHTRAQFLLNHALDAAKIKLQFRGYNYMTWNVLEDCLKKARSKILRENPSRVEQFTDVELVEWIMEETKVFLQSATALLYEAMHGPGQTPDNKIVEDCYLDQLNKALGSQAFMFEQEEALDDALKTGDVAKFAVLLVQKTLNNAMMGIPRRSSVMLAQALKESNYDLAGSLLSAKAITVAHRKVQLEPAKTSDGAGFRDAYHKGDLETAGTILATRAMQHAMDIHPAESDPLESSISNMVLKNALEQGDLTQASDIIIEQALREALCYANTPTQEISLEDA
eukprot:sb/3461466/